MLSVKMRGGEEKMGFLVGSCKICYSGIFLCVFQFTLYEFFYAFSSLTNVNINDDEDDKKVVMAR